MVSHSTIPLLIVPDTNVCVNGTTISQRAPYQIINAWKAGSIDFAFCEPMLEEIADVLFRPYFRDEVGWKELKIFEYVDQLREGSFIQPGTTPVMVSPDPDDNILFATALEAQADYIVSYDKKHVLKVGEYQGIKTIHPFDFVKDILQMNPLK